MPTTTPSTVTKGLIQYALDYYYTEHSDGYDKPLYSQESVKIAEDWIGEQETSEEEAKRVRKENGTKMRNVIEKALSSYEYTVLDESNNVADEEYLILREAQQWTERLIPGEDIF